MPYASLPAFCLSDSHRHVLYVFARATALIPQAASANVEKSRSLTWDEAMKAGDAPLPAAEDDVYVDTGAKVDIHQLAAAVRKHRAALSELQQQWNELVRVRQRRCGRGVLNQRAAASHAWQAPHKWWSLPSRLLWRLPCGAAVCLIMWRHLMVVAGCLDSLTSLSCCVHCVQRKASQPELRELRGRLNAARAEVTVAQGELVAARTEETRRRELKAAESKTDPTLGEPQQQAGAGAEPPSCSPSMSPARSPHCISAAATVCLSLAAKAPQRFAVVLVSSKWS